MSVIELTDDMRTDYQRRVEAEQARRTQERELEQRRERLDYSGIELRDAVREAIIHRTHHETGPVLAVRDWAKRFHPPMLLLAGTVGTGKTVGAATVLAARSGVFITARELARAFRASWGDDLAIQERVMTAHLLVIDDIGREPDAGHMAMVLEDLLDARCSTRRPTLVTTNLDGARWSRRYGDERLVSRMHELTRWEAFVGPDLRREPLRGDHA